MLLDLTRPCYDHTGKKLARHVGNRSNGDLIFEVEERVIVVNREGISRNRMRITNTKATSVLRKYAPGDTVYQMRMGSNHAIIRKGVIVRAQPGCLILLDAETGKEVRAPHYTVGTRAEMEKRVEQVREAWRKVSG